VRAGPADVCATVLCSLSVLYGVLLYKKSAFFANSNTAVSILIHTFKGTQVHSSLHTQSGIAGVCDSHLQRELLNCFPK
jgi:hypothetical protein